MPKRSISLMIVLTLCAAAQAQDAPAVTPSPAPDPEVAPPTAPDAPQVPTEGVGVEPMPAPSEALLALCSSPDPQARAYCLSQLEAATQLDPPAYDALVRLAAEPSDLSKRAADHYLKRYHHPAPAASVRPAPQRSLGDPTRNVLAPTGFNLRRGETSLQVQELGLYDFSYGVNDQLSLGARTILPIGLVGASALARYSVPFTGGSVSFYGELGGGGVISEAAVFVGGGGFALTLGSNDSSLTIGTLAYHLALGSSELTFIAPHLAASRRLGSQVRLNAELYLPFVKTSHAAMEFSKLGLLLWSVRIGRRIYGDVGFIDPICEGCAEAYQIFPLGIPYLGFGVTL